MLNNEPIVTVENVSHRYASTQWAVNNVSFDLSKNGITGLLGSNGAGKSTLMNIMCGVLTATKGRVAINGKDINRKRVEAKMQLGFLPQKPPLHIDLTVEEYLRYTAGLRLVERKHIKQFVNEAMAKCAITHFKDRLIKNLSGGYQQRVGIAQAIIHKPLFVILDEPTNGLDPNQILEIRNLIKDISHDQTVLLSTHILSEVAAMCEDVKMLEHGDMVFEGNITEFNNCVKLNSVSVHLMNPPSLDILRGLDGVSSVVDKGENNYLFNLENGSISTEYIIKLSIENNWRLLEIKREKASLDEVFAYLSQNE
ncbi:ABC transporter ATP-binding protein [Puteibacter caeruleilacunae]|nr:ABC transporter ATP-binding protein [Puteibacter caeruleilacunae]